MGTRFQFGLSPQVRVQVCVCVCERESQSTGFSRKRLKSQSQQRPLAVQSRPSLSEKRRKHEARQVD